MVSFDGLSVVTLTAALSVDTLPRVSLARTVKEYVVFGVSPVTVAVVPVTDVARVLPR